MKKKSWFCLIGGLLFTLLVTIESPLSFAALPTDQWSPQERIPDYDDEAAPPYLVADQNRTVHAFNSQPVDDVLAIVYRQWSIAQGWTAPVDILLSPEKKQARVMGAFLDQAETLHVIFFGGDDLGANIYYSQAPAIKAGQAHAWSTPKVIGEDAVTPSIAALAGDDVGNLFVVYSGQPEGKGLYAVYSSDAGNTWTDSVPIYLTYDDLHFLWALQTHADEQGRLHVVWTVNNDIGNGEAVFYAQLEANHKQWSEPVILAERQEDEYEADWPAIISHNGELIVIYNDSAPATRWMRRSLNGGQTWTEPIKPFPSEGEYGHPLFLVDSENVLHVLLGNRRGSFHGMWHSVWEGNRWRDLEPVVSGPVSEIPGEEFDPTLPNGVVSQGNILLVTWETDNGVGQNGAWYSYLIRDIPELPIVALPTVATTPIVTPSPTSTPPLPTPTPSPERPIFTDAPSSGGPFSVLSSPATPLIIGIIPVVMLISLVVLVQRLFARSHH